MRQSCEVKVHFFMVNYSKNHKKIAKMIQHLQTSALVPFHIFSLDVPYNKSH